MLLRVPNDRAIFQLLVCNFVNNRLLRGEMIARGFARNPRSLGEFPFHDKLINSSTSLSSIAVDLVERYDTRHSISMHAPLIPKRSNYFRAIAKDAQITSKTLPTALCFLLPHDSSRITTVVLPLLFFVTDATVNVYPFAILYETPVFRASCTVRLRNENGSWYTWSLK